MKKVSSQLRKDALEKAQKELNDIKFALDTSAIIAITDEAGIITYVNDKFCEVSQYSRNEVLGSDHRIVNSGFHPKEFMRDLWTTILNGSVWRGEIRNRAKDGSYYWVHTTIVPFLDSQGKPYQFISIRYDITERKRMEEEVKHISQRILAAQEAERETISREIHDDLGHSLATLKMLMQSVLDEQRTFTSLERRKLNRKVIKYCDASIDKTRRLAAGLRPSTLEVLGLTNAIRMLLDDLKAQKKYKVKTHIEQLDHLNLPGEAINLYRIAQEALANAISHSSAGLIEVTFRKYKDKLRMKIRDDGQGFNPSAVRDNSPDQFLPLDGIGLYTMKERTKLLKGHIEIKSQPGRGTIVILEVPIVGSTQQQ